MSSIAKFIGISISSVLVMALSLYLTSFLGAKARSNESVPSANQSAQPVAEIPVENQNMTSTSNDYVYDPTGKRDPFRPYDPKLDAQAMANLSPEEKQKLELQQKLEITQKHEPQKIDINVNVKSPEMQMIQGNLKLDNPMIQQVQQPGEPRNLLPEEKEEELPPPPPPKRTQITEFMLDELKLVAVIWDTEKPRAMVKDIDGGVYTIRPLSKIGNRSGYVANIREGEIVVIEKSDETKKKEAKVLAIQR